MFNLTEVSERIMLARKKAGFTQMELANILGVSFQAISNWERGVAMPDISNLEPLAKALGVTVDEILCDRKIASLIKDGEMPDEISVDEFNAVSSLLQPDQNAELLKRVNNVSGDSQKINIESLCVTKNEIEEMALKAYENGSVSTFAVMLPHCSVEFISTQIYRAYEDSKTAMFAIMTPHITAKQRSELFKRATGEGKPSFVAVLAPHIAAELNHDNTED